MAPNSLDGLIVLPSYLCEQTRKKTCEIHNDKWILNLKLLSEQGMDGLDIRWFDGGSTE